MSRLLSADFAKLKKNRFFWLCIIGMVGFGLFMKIMEYITMQQYADEAPPLDSMLSVYSMVIGFLTAAFVSLFVGTEYSDGDLEITLDENGMITFANHSDKLDEILVGRLFDRFYTVETASSGSTGLGLSIARALTEQMGGSITAEYQSGMILVHVHFPQHLL